VIDAELGRENHNSIPTTAIEREFEPLNDRTITPDQIKLVVKVEKNKISLKKLVELHFD
jgi:hypothetical protein